MVTGGIFLRRGRPNFCVDNLRLPFVLPRTGVAEDPAGPQARGGWSVGGLAPS
jgi:hypothetical protein